MVFGEGDTERTLTEDEIRDICAEGLEAMHPDGKKILCVIPDHSRTAPVDVMFRTVYDLLTGRVRRLDFLIALGTHPPISEEMIRARVGITKEEQSAKYPEARFFNHRWDDPLQLAQIGVIPESETAEISGGLMREPVPVTINKMVLKYDRILIIGPVFPHEVAGFSGGNKYLFPGIAGAAIIDMFHWLGALITNMAIIGTRDTPVRAVIDKAASFLPVDIYCLALVVKGTGVAGLYSGLSKEAWREASFLSEKLHIIYKDRPFDRVLSCAPRMYDDLWTGGKCMYKLEPVVADGGELIIYAPHISEVSVTHGRYLRKIGYHVRDYFTKQWKQFPDIPGGVMAHSTHVRGLGTFENGVEKPRIRVTLATAIPKEACNRINLGYRDPATIRPEEWAGREDEGILYIPKAGEMLYRLKAEG